MRIRKNAKVSPLLYSSHASAPEIWQTHVCRLNQSPWDVIPFSPDSNHQPEAEDNSFSGNASLGDSIGAVESVASLRAAGPMKLEETALKNDNQKKKEVVDREVKMADDDDDENHETNEYDNNNNNNSYKTKKQRNYGGELLVKGKNEAKDHDHHQLNLAAAAGNYNNYDSNNNDDDDDHTVRDYEDPHYNPTTSSYKKLSPALPATTASTRAATRKKAAGRGKNPNEFYYYSGFGPLWGKKRGNRGNTDMDQAHDNLIIENVEIMDHPMAAATGSATTNTTDLNSNSSLIDDDDDDNDNDEEDEDDDDDDFGNGSERRRMKKNKRMRKPVKARSLKSLM